VKQMVKKLLLTSLAVMAGCFLIVTTASANTHTYKDKTTRATVTVTKKKGKVTAIVYQLKDTSKFSKRYRKRTKFYTKMTIKKGSQPYLIRKNHKGTVTFNRKMSKWDSKYPTEQTNPVRGMTSDGTTAIFMNVSYFGKLKAKKYHNVAAHFSWWWNTLPGYLPKDNPDGDAIVLNNGKVLFEDYKLSKKLPD